MNASYYELPRVFVFGSNLKGIHGAGAAAYAARWRGAKRGHGEGPMGGENPSEPLCYAIPTKETPYTRLSLNEIRRRVERFIQYAEDHPELDFQVTRIGCGLAGWSDDDIAPMFDDAPLNCVLPGIWLKRKNPDLARIIVTGAESLKDRDFVFESLDSAVSNIAGHKGLVEIVSGGAPGPETWSIEWANERLRPESAVKFQTDWNRYGKAAVMLRNQDMAWYATHLIAFWDGSSSGTRNMIDTAKMAGLEVKVINACNS